MSKVSIYTTPTCSYCHMAKSYFSQNNIEYKEYDVSKDQDKAHEMVHKTGQMGVPVIVIGNEVIVGFDKQGIEMTLKEQGII